MTRLLVVAAASACACFGEPLQYGGYEGEVLDRIECTFAVDGENVPAGVARQKVAIVWLGPGLADIVDVWDDELDRSPGELGMRVSILQRPTTLQRAHGAIEGEAAFGQIVSFSDDDFDGSWDPGSEPIVGMDLELVVAFSSEGVSGPDVGELAPGFTHFRTRSCADAGSVPRPVEPGASWACRIDTVDSAAVPFFEFCAP